MTETNASWPTDAVRSDTRDVAAEHRVLEQRARRLAARHDDAASARPGVDTLVFRRGSDRFAIPVKAIVEVQRPGGFTPLPGAAAPALGVIAWRGRILTVVDAAAGGRGLALAVGWRAIVIGEARARVAIVADSVEDTRTIAPDEPVPLDEAESATMPIPVRGVTPDAVIVIDGDALLQRYAG